jgi:NADPH:quinone reductase-like Zn-dependent oxidoreductase
MRSAIHAGFGDPAEVLSFADSPLPNPGPGQARVRMLLSPIHNHDLWTIRGQYGYKPALPAIGGSEAVGVVDALGEGATGVAVGQRVTTASARGAWAEYFVVPASTLVPVPDAIDDATAAQLVAMPLSALLLLELLQVPPGEWIVQNAANGAVGKALAMLAAARGVHVLNLVRRQAGVEEMAAQGIGNTVCTAGEGWKSQVRELLGGKRAVAAVDSVGGADSGMLASLLGEGGVLVAFGSMTGEPMQIPSGELIFKQLVVKGFWGIPAMKALSPQDQRRLMGELLQRAASGELRLPVASVHPLEDVAIAVREGMVPGRASLGKILLRA